MQNKLLVISGGNKNFRATVRKALEQSTVIHRIEEAENSEALHEIAEKRPIAVLLFDARWLQSKNTATLQSEYHLSPQTRCLIYHEQLSKVSVRQALERGAQGCLLESSSEDDWCKAVQAVACDGIWFPLSLLTDALMPGPRRVRKSMFSSESDSTLTSREREIRECVTEGMTNKEIARCLGISPTTVKTHLQHMFGKLKVNHRVMLLKNNDALS